MSKTLQTELAAVLLWNITNLPSPYFCVKNPPNKIGSRTIMEQYKPPFPLFLCQKPYKRTLNIEIWVVTMTYVVAHIATFLTEQRTLV